MSKQKNCGVVVACSLLAAFALAPGGRGPNLRPPGHVAIPPTCFLARHAIGDWGDLEPSDAAENEYGIAHGVSISEQLHNNRRGARSTKSGMRNWSRRGWCGAPLLRRRFPCWR